MATTASPTPAQMLAISPGAQYLNAFEMELATTLKVLRAFPADNETLQPSPKGKNARDLAFMFVREMGLGIVALTTGLDWSNPPASPAPPAKISDIVPILDQTHRQLADIVGKLTDEQLVTETVLFPSGPGQMADMPKIQFLWMLLMDQIHHRGQFSVYLRIAGGRLPSIYGPTADEPWH